MPELPHQAPRLTFAIVLSDSSGRLSRYNKEKRGLRPGGSKGSTPLISTHARLQEVAVIALALAINAVFQATTLQEVLPRQLQRSLASEPPDTM